MGLAEKSDWKEAEGLLTAAQDQPYLTGSMDSTF